MHAHDFGYIQHYIYTSPTSAFNSFDMHDTNFGYDTILHLVAILNNIENYAPSFVIKKVQKKTKKGIHDFVIHSHSYNTIISAFDIFNDYIIAFITKNKTKKAKRVEIIENKKEKVKENDLL